MARRPNGDDSGKLHEISVAIGDLSASFRYQAAELENMRRDGEANRRTQSRRHEQNQASIAAIAAKVDEQTAIVAPLRETVAALSTKLDAQVAIVAMLRSKIAAWTLVAFGLIVFIGWIFEAGVKWLVSWILTKLGG
jgi:hypothetical protein